MKLKLDENGHVVVQDGKPVYIKDSGEEVAFDAQYTVGTIERLNSEAKTNRERYEKAEESLKSFSGIDDPVAAKKALETLKNFDDKKLVDAGEIEKLKVELGQSYKDSYEPQINEWKQKAEQATAALQKELIGGGFARSKFIQENIAVPVDMLQHTFGQNFKVEDGKTVAYDANGQKIYSRTDPSQLASFDEAIEHLVGGYQHKDSILKGKQSGGGGFNGGVNTPTQHSGNMGGSAEERRAAIAAKFKLSE